MELVSTDSKDVMATTNTDITLNTELVFRNKGSCGVRPRLTQVQLQLNSNEIRLNCQSEDQCEDGRVSYDALGNITITNAMSDDAGNYRFGAQVSCPSQIVQTKDFVVTVTGAVVIIFLCFCSFLLLFRFKWTHTQIKKEYKQVH